MRLLLLLLSFSLMTGCSTRQRNTGESCLDAAECTVDEGELAACVDNRCRGVECLSSSDCSLGSFCEIEDEDYECVEGCLSNLDCAAGESCSEDGQCEAYGCRSTNLDCDLGEICDPEAGECFEPPGAWCNTCEFADSDWDDQGTFSVCDDIYLGHGPCGGTGAMCLTVIENGPQTCLPKCDGPEDCPRGHVCQEVDLDLNVTNPLEPCTEVPVTGQICIPALPCSEFP